MPDIADEHQAATSQRQAIIVAIRLKRPGDGLSALVKTGDKIATHEAKPVGVGRNLVIGVDCCDRVFQIDDRRERRFKDDIGDVQFICRANRVLRIDQDFNMQAVMLEQITRSVTGLCFCDEIWAFVASQSCLPTGNGFVQEAARIGHDCRATIRVIAAGPCSWRGQDVGPIQRVI